MAFDQFRANRLNEPQLPIDAACMPLPQLIELKMRRRAAVTVPHIMSVPFLVASSDLIATVPRLVGECFSMLSNIKMVPPPFETPMIEVKQFWHRRFHSEPRSMWFRGLLKSIFRNAEFKGPALKASQRDCK